MEWMIRALNLRFFFINTCLDMTVYFAFKNMVLWAKSAFLALPEEFLQEFEVNPTMAVLRNSVNYIKTTERSDTTTLDTFNLFGFKPLSGVKPKPPPLGSDIYSFFLNKASFWINFLTFQSATLFPL